MHDYFSNVHERTRDEGSEREKVQEREEQRGEKTRASLSLTFLWFLSFSHAVYYHPASWFFVQIDRV
jgi:hypothetical protein